MKSIRNAERDLHVLFGRMGLTLPIKPSCEKPLVIYNCSLGF